MSVVTHDQDGDIAIITLNRPKAANAINITLAAELKDAAERIREDGRTRAVVVRAEGKMFSAGGDIQLMMEQRDAQNDAGYADFFRTLASGLHAAVRGLVAIPAPIIASVNGVAAGGGMSIALACDLLIASRRAKFVPAYPAIGLTTDGGMSWTLARAVGERKALQLILENKPIDADEAHRLGIVTELLDEDGFDERVLEKARRLARMPRRAVAIQRTLFHESGRSSFEAHLERELESISSLSGAGDAREGLTAYREKREPKFAD